MKLRAFVLLAAIGLARAKDLPNHAFLYERDPALIEKRTVPQATPTGPLCSGGQATASAGPIINPSDVAKAVRGCQGVNPTGETRNDILNGVCKQVTLIFARGTTEKGNLGSIVGPPFVLALEKAFGARNVAVQGVNDYPATTDDYCAGGSLSGSRNLAQLIQRTRKQCPDTVLCVSGYSQGAQVVHNAAELLQSNAAATNFISSVVTFGDPFRKLPVGNVPSSKVRIFCHPGDNICQNGKSTFNSSWPLLTFSLGEIIKPQHLNYCHNVGAAAMFVKARSRA